jgi:hypothetical protein
MLSGRIRVSLTPCRKQHLTPHITKDKPPHVNGADFDDDQEEIPYFIDRTRIIYSTINHA